MTELIFTDSKNVLNELEKAVTPYICGSFEIKRTKNGKPYIKGNPVYFSVSHSKDKAVIALCDKPVGVDLELFGQKKHDSVLSRFSEREKLEIGCDLKKFLENWTAKEAFIKSRGGTLANLIKRLEYCGGQIYLDKKPQNCGICAHEYDFGIVTTCILI